MTDAPLASYSHELEVKEYAERIYYFLKRVMQDLEGAEAILDREELLRYLEAYKSPYFMRLIEEDRELEFDIKAKLATGVSSMNKSWPIVRQTVYDPTALKFAAVAWKMTQMGNEVLSALGIHVTENAEWHEIKPEELPPP